MSIVEIAPPRVINFRDGYFTGASGGGGVTFPGSMTDFPPTAHFRNIPPMTPRTSNLPNVAQRINKRIVYVNGIQTFSQGHGNTVKLISVLTGADVCGVYNMSGDGRETAVSKNTEMVLSIVSPPMGAAARGVNILHSINGFLTDLGQCIDDKLLQVQNNPATLTLARAIVEACVGNVPINIIAHSQGAIITSGAVRVAISAIAIIYTAEESSHQNHNLLQILKDMTIFGQIERFNRLRRIHQRIKTLMRRLVSIQTFGGAATWYPDGPWYRHVYNTAAAFSGDPVAKLFGQGNIFAHSGRGATVERLHRGGRGVSGNHSIDNNYLQTSGDYSGGDIVYDTNYVPIHIDMLR